MSDTSIPPLVFDASPVLLWNDHPCQCCGPRHCFGIGLEVPTRKGQSREAATDELLDWITRHRHTIGGKRIHITAEVLDWPAT